MGIQGLLPFLKKIHTPVNVSQFRGCTVAIDAYCWLHKGAFSCADKLALGEKTEQYVFYCMKYVDYLLRNGLKPILVFDGCHLPSKKDVETSRRERRELNRKRAAQLLREGKRTEARECLQRCIDISPQMALQLMKACRARGVDCIVAPYEADAQLAYLSKAGIAQVIITEDSDLLLFGCEKVIFKMDFFGNGTLIERSRLNEVVDIQDGFYTFDKFRYMCILSGCDYLPSLPGIGLGKASKVFKVARQTDIRQLLKKLPSYLKMNLVVPNDYIDGFIRADNTFLYQLSFDPLTRSLCPLNPYPPEVEIEELRYAGPYFSDERALQIALGNIDIHTHEKLDDFDPATFIPKYAKKPDQEMLHQLSIWNPNYAVLSKSATTVATTEGTIPSRPCVAGKEVHIRNTLPKSCAKRVREVDDSEDVKTDSELTSLYSAAQAEKRCRKSSDENHAPSATDRKVLSNEEDEHDLKPRERDNAAEKKQVLSPSKPSNRAVTADDAMYLMDRESASRTAVGEKESNKKSPTPNRNKFAVSALAKRAKFSLDSPALPNVKVEVKSRYFSPGSSANTSTASDSVVSPRDISNKSEKAPSETFFMKKVANNSLKANDPDTQSDFKSTPKTLERKASKEASPLSTEKPSVLSRFSYSAKPSEIKGKNSGVPKPDGRQAQGTPSPGSAFSWSNFRFAKSNSTPDLSHTLPVSANSQKPFKRVSSDSRGSQGFQNSSQDLLLQEGREETKGKDSQNDSCYFSLDGDSKDHEVSGGGDCGTILDISGTGSQQSDDTAPSQHSNLYSIDSDCWPTSQDCVDLTDSESCSQRSDSTQASYLASPASQVSLKSAINISTPRNAAGVKKCRVSGLSRGKKKSPAATDDKQQKIKDMFSRFAHQKSKSFSQEMNSSS